RAAAAAAAKPVVCWFLDEMTLEEGALEAAAAVGLPETAPSPARVAAPISGRLIRGLYAGGSLAAEAKLVIRRAGLGPEHEIVDLGAEQFVRGRPHPMIDSRERRVQLAAAVADEDVAVVLLDFVLGYGAAPDPAGDLADAIAAADGVAILASLVGTDRDPQGLAAQAATLRA